MKGMEGLISVVDLAMLRNIAEAKCSTEQGIREQIKLLETGKKRPTDVGFEVVRPTKSVVLVRVTDPELEKFRLGLKAWAEKNKPK